MARGGRRVMSRPSYSIAPRSGLRNPVIMLMKVVLPAPLVPIRPTTESCWIAALTSFAAVTAPNALFKPLALRMTDTAAEQRPQPFGQEHDDEEQRGAQAELPGVRRQIVGSGVDHAIEQRAGERRDHAPGAGEDGDEDELAGSGPERHIGIDVADGGRGERAAHAG